MLKILNFRAKLHLGIFICFVGEGLCPLPIFLDIFVGIVGNGDFRHSVFYKKSRHKTISLLSCLRRVLLESKEPKTQGVSEPPASPTDKGSALDPFDFCKQKYFLRVSLRTLCIRTGIFTYYLFALFIIVSKEEVNDRCQAVFKQT